MMITVNKFSASRLVPRLLGGLLVSGFGIVQLVAGTASQYWTNAQTVHSFIVGHLLSTNNSYRIEPQSATSYEWYNVSQMYADSAMVSAGDASCADSMLHTYAWMSNLWDSASSNGGYFASANIDGGNAGGGKYVDDNALAGNVYLDCYAVSSGITKSNLLNSAKATADWLIQGGQWDDTFGGGFWWDLSKKNKPTQSNGLAMQLFLRLYQITGKTEYSDWANSVKGWLETRMFNPTNGVYVWQITTNGTPQGDKDYRVFTYDNAIMIEADLLYKQVFNDSACLVKAQKLAASLNAVLWNNESGCYGFNTGDRRVNPCWCGWASQSMIKLYEADGNTNWLNNAQRNIDFINSHLRDPSTGGYYQYCRMDGSHVQTTIEAVDQSWMQKIQAMLSKYR